MQNIYLRRMNALQFRTNFIAIAFEGGNIYIYIYILRKRKRDREKIF